MYTILGDENIMSVDEKQPQTYVTDALGSEKYCFLKAGLNNGPFEVPGVPTEMYESCGEVT